MLWEEMEKYTELTGEDAEHVPIMKIGAYLDGYEKGIEIINKLRAEIIERKHLYQLNEVSTDHSGATGEQALKWVLETIDKLLSEQAESEG